MVIGVLSLQGDFKEHIEALRNSGVEAIEVRSKADLETCGALVIPGGESTTIGKLLRLTGLDKEIITRFQAGDLKVWGTCAGAILCATEVESENPVLNLGLGNYKISRNAYGNQLDSFETVSNFNGQFEVECAFIRAPKLLEFDSSFKVLAKVNDEAVFIEKGNLLVSTCHPELYENVEFYKCLKGWVTS